MRHLLTALLLMALAPSLLAQDEKPEPEVVGGDWLVLASVDSRGRQPFNPDAVFARYLLDLPVQAPEEGQLVRGTKGSAQRWTKTAADEKGFVAGRISYAYRRYDSAGERVVLAALPGGSTLFVNEDVHAGDVYGMNSGPVPVALREGVNHIFVRGVRGKFRLTFEEATSTIMFTERDHTAPDLIRGQDYSGELAVTVVNTSRTEWASPALTGTVGVGGGNAWDVFIRKAPDIAPLGVLKLPVKFSIPASASLGEDGVEPPTEVELDVTGSANPEEEWLRQRLIGPKLKLRVREPEQPRKITFRSAIDDSVQYYAVLPPTGEARGVVLSLHGAGVQAPGQARSYGPKDDLWILAPTNRRRFGFDWQDWGRRDAYEALDHLLAATGVDPTAVFLTGHSMGGHGTWHLAANDPDRFRAIAPSAGWSQFDHYGGRPVSARVEPWLGADRASGTMSLIDNLRQIPTFVLHGEKDDNVPLSEAERMLAALRGAGAAPQHHFEPDKKHWWDGYPEPGAQCVDWPGIFDLFAAEPPPANDQIAFTSVDPGVDAEHRFVRVEQPLVYGQAFSVSSERMGESVHVDCVNVALMRVRTTTPGRESVYVLDGSTVHVGAEDEVWFERIDGKWNVVAGPEPAPEKSAALSGPFKRAFDNEFVMVVGTKGTDEEDAALLRRARYDAQVWAYRGNGRAEIVADVGFGLRDFGGRNILIYGNRDTNAAWQRIVGDYAHIQAARGRLTVGGTEYEGDAYAAIFVRPRNDDVTALVGAFADTGVAGSRLGYSLLTFVSGVGYPDWTVFSPAVLHAGTPGVLEAGWYDAGWRVQKE